MYHKNERVLQKKKNKNQEEKIAIFSLSSLIFFPSRPPSCRRRRRRCHRRRCSVIIHVQYMRERNGKSGKNIICGVCASCYNTHMTK
jgi:hypothetical protein